MASQLASIATVDRLPGDQPSHCVSPDSASTTTSSSSSTCEGGRLLDTDGLPLISRETIIDQLWNAGEDRTMSIVELTKAFRLDKKKNGPARRYKFRQIIAEITYIRNDRVKGFSLVLKKRNYPTAR